MNIRKVDFQASNAAAEFTASLHETGFGVLGNHPIPHDLLFTVYDEWEKFFASKEKHDYTYSQDTQDGYFPYLSENAKGYSESDLKEFFHYYNWGKYPDSLSDATKQLRDMMTEVASTLLRWIEQYTPAEISANFSMPLSDMIKNSKRTLFRILHYPPLKGDEPEGAIRAAAHGDINLITLLPAATAMGLQVKDKNGSWTDVACDPGMLVVNIGDMLQMITEGFYPSTLHRVINPVGAEKSSSRYSMPLFLHPCDDVRLSADYTAEDYRLERLREIGLLKDETA